MHEAAAVGDELGRDLAIDVGDEDVRPAGGERRAVEVEIGPHPGVRSGALLQQVHHEAGDERRLADAAEPVEHQSRIRQKARVRQRRAPELVQLRELRLAADAADRRRGGGPRA